MMISPGFFSFSLNFDFLGCSGGERAKKKKLKMENKNYIRTASYLRNSVAYDHDDISGSFFHFFKF